MFINNLIASEVKHLVQYSQSCVGQSRKIKMTLRLLLIWQRSLTLKVIDQKYFVPQHRRNTFYHDVVMIKKGNHFHPEVFIPNPRCRGEWWSSLLKKNGIFWDVTPCGSCKNQRFGGTWRLLHQGDKNQ
jgi:hypothetical protein